jgi:PST family polysaccharide transporter
MVVTFFVGVLLARYLGPSAYADWGFCVASIGIFSGFVLLGVDRIVIRDLIKNPDRERLILGTVIFVKAASTGIMVCLVLVSVILSQKSELLPIAFLLCMAQLMMCFNVLDYSFQAKSKFGKLVPVRMAVLAITSSLKIAFIYLGLDLISFVAVSLIESTMLSICALYVYFKTYGNFPIFNFDSRYMKKLILDGWPLFLAINLDFFLQKISLYYIGFSLDKNSFGQFFLACQLLDAVLSVVQLSSTTVVPKLMEAKLIGEVIYKNSLLRVIRIWAILGLIITLATYFLSNELLDILFGEKYYALKDIFALIVITILIQSFGIFRASYLVIQKKQKDILSINGIALLLNLMITAFLINFYGIWGAALSIPLGNFVLYELASLTTKSGRDFLILQAKIFGGATSA